MSVRVRVGECHRVWVRMCVWVAAFCKWRLCACVATFFSLNFLCSKWIVRKSLKKAVLSRINNNGQVQFTRLPDGMGSQTSPCPSIEQIVNECIQWQS